MATDPHALLFDGTEWSRELSVVFNGVEVPIQIEPESYETDGESSRMSSVQIQALRDLMSLAPDVLERSAPAVVQNYEVYREMLGDEDCPPLQRPVDVWQQVQPSYFSIPPHQGLATPSFLLFAECDWDPEHGLTVRFRNGIADVSNQQGEVGI